MLGMCYFYFSWYGDHRVLHSFPTRRSSDLSRLSRWRSDARRGTSDGDRASSIVPRRARSEEHTSELQSQSNLVCRLLLEKKTRSSSRPSRTTATSLYPTCRTHRSASLPSRL